MNDFEKITPTCSNVYLIDQNFCVGNSLNTINYNFSSINFSISSLEQYNQDWYQLYTIFTTYSSKWIKTATNIQTFSAKWIDTSTTVQNLSSRWSKPIVLYHTQMQNLSTWYSLTTSARCEYAKNFINTILDSKKYSPDQIVDVVIYLNQNLPFSFYFGRKYNETCIPNGGGISLKCEKSGLPVHGCNRSSGKGKNYYHYCFNAYEQCGKTRSGQSASASCVGTGGRLLSVGIDRKAEDKNVARTDLIRFKNINMTWTPL